MPPPTRQGRLAQNLPHQRVIRPGLEGAVEIDELHARIAFELPYPREHIVARQREPFALNELDDLAALEIDRRNEHEDE